MLSMSQNVPKQNISEIQHHFRFIRKPAWTLSGAGAELDIRRSAAVWEISLISGNLISVCSGFISVELCKKYCGLTSSANVASTSNLLCLTYRRATGSNQWWRYWVGRANSSLMGEENTRFFKSLKLSGVSGGGAKTIAIYALQLWGWGGEIREGRMKLSEKGWRGGGHSPWLNHSSIVCQGSSSNAKKIQSGRKEKS